MKMIFLIFLLIGWRLEAKEVEKAFATKCTSSQMIRRSCDLKSNGYQLFLTPDRVTIGDGKNKSVHDLPYKGEGVEWHRVELRQIHQRWLMEFEFLTPAQGEAEIQNLVWVVLELKETGWTKHINEVVQKRRRKRMVASSLSSISFSPKMSQEDSKEKFGLKANKSGMIEWWVGSLKGEF